MKILVILLSLLTISPLLPSPAVACETYEPDCDGETRGDNDDSDDADDQQDEPDTGPDGDEGDTGGL